MIYVNDATDSGTVDVSRSSSKVHLDFTRNDGFKCGFSLSKAEAVELAIELLGGKKS